MNSASDNPLKQQLSTALDRSFRLLADHYPGWEGFILNEVDSTNNEAKRRATAGSLPPVGAVIAALHQTAGRGTGDRRWEAIPGKALLVSFVVRREALARKDSGFGRARHNYPPTLWPLQIGLVLALRLRLAGYEATLKWPNDVLIAEKKVAGILCEMTREALAVGVGLNLLQGADELPEPRPGGRRPTSLALEKDNYSAEGKDCLDPLAILPSILQGIVAVLESPWPIEKTIEFYEDWCATLGKCVTGNCIEGHHSTGVAFGINHDGSLKVEEIGGRVITINSEIQEK